MTLDCVIICDVRDGIAYNIKQKQYRSYLSRQMWASTLD